VLLRFMEPWYRPKKTEVSGDQKSQGGSNRPSTPTSIDTETGSAYGEATVHGESTPLSTPLAGKDEDSWRASMIARRDVHVVFISYLLEALSEMCIGLARNGTQMILASVALGCVGSSGPAMRSAAVASVPPLQGGEILATFEIVASFAHLLAPLQGVLLTLLINTVPQVVFFLGGGISLLAALLTLFVRERDRFR